MLYMRADMNNIIATGHIMRCLSIADAAKDMGEDTTFILADDQASDLLKERGYQGIILNTRWNDMDSEVPIIKELAEKYRIEKMLIDSYQVTESYLRSLSEIVETFYIDDLNVLLYPVKNIICYANYWERFNYTERYKNSRLFLGTRYVPLRKEFGVCEEKEICSQVKKILLLSGGADKYHILGQILNRLNLEKYMQIDVICGRFDAQYDELKEVESMKGNVKVYRAVSDIKRYMEEADLVISAGGTTLYELCAVGTPSISYSIADNQLENVKKFHEDGIIDYAGDVRKDNVLENIERYLRMYHSDQKIRKEKSIKMQKLVDGKGAWRIAKVITDDCRRNT